MAAERNASPQARQPVPAQSPALPRPVTLANHWLHKGGIVLHFDGIESITDAETLTGLGVAIPRSQRTALCEDQAYIGDLIGCTLVDLAGTGKSDAGPAEVGVIEDQWTASRPVRSVGRALLGPAGGEILVPFAKSYLRRSTSKPAAWRWICPRAW